LTPSIRIRGHPTSHDGEIAFDRALDGQGIPTRAEWDNERHLKNGPLVHRWRLDEGN